MEMKAKQLLEKLNFTLDKDELEFIKKETEKFTLLMEKEIKNRKINTDVFPGGSYAKGTLVKKDKQDVDIFVRFDWRYDNISEMLEKILEKLCRKRKLKLEKIHGSRDYFHVSEGAKLVFEVVPVTRIKKQKEARNVTDLSYFHVNYVKKKLNKKPKIAKEIVLAKTFCRAQKVYGAESYIHGFSGYGLECLVIYYGSFEKMLRNLAKTKERIVIDAEKQYKNKKDVFFEINESKLNSPVVLVDPTWKERNALAGLSNETFERFKAAAIAFLKKPSEEFFIKKELNEDELKREAKKLKAEFLRIRLETDRQEGDIAGTKLKKFADFLAEKLSKYFIILKKEFEYNDKRAGNAYYIAKSKGEIIKNGPPVKFKQHAVAFKKANKNVYEKNKILFARIKINFSAKSYLRKLEKEFGETIKEMGITGVKITN